MKLSTFACACFAFVATSVFAGECAIGAADPTEITYDCCGEENSLSETIVAPITCDNEECGTATGNLDVTRDDCEDYETPVTVTVSGSCSHGSSPSKDVSVDLVKKDSSDSTCGDDGSGQTSAAGYTETASQYSDVQVTSGQNLLMAASPRMGRYVPKGAPTWHISLGGNASGAFSGRLELIPSLLFNPNLRRLDSSILKLTGSAKSGLDIVNFTSTRWIEELRWEGGRQRRYIRIERLVDRRRFVGIKSKDGYAAFSSPTNFPFSVSFYRNADIGDEYDLEGNYLLVTNSLPYAVYEIGYGDTNLHAQAYSLCVRRRGAPAERIELYCDDADGVTTYGINRGNGAWARELTSVPASAAGIRQIVERIKGAGGYERIVTDEYRTVNGKDVLIARTRQSGVETRKDQYTYYENGKRKTHLSSSGLLTEYEYDERNRRTVVRETSPDGRIAETRSSYAPLNVRPHSPEDAATVGIADDDGSVDSGTPRVETRYEDGVPVSKTLRFIALDTMKHRIVEEVRLADPGATDLTNAWESAANVRTYTDYMPYDRCKPCSKLPSLVMRADGTIDRYAYSAGEYEPGANGAAGVFTDSGVGEGDWFRTVVTHYAAGDVEIPNVTTRDVKIEIRSSKKTLLQEQYVCTAPGAYARVSWTATTRDALGQETLVVKSDGTCAEKTYAGRRLASMTDAEGLKTTYSYDALGRVIAETKSGGGIRPDTTTTTTYDPEDRILSRTVTSGDLSETETYAYDALGRTVSTIDAAGIETRYLYATDATAGLETRTTIRAFGTDCAVTNTVVSYADGRTKETLLNGVVKTAYEYGPNWTKTYEGPAGLASPRWSYSHEDALGRTICETRPGFRGSLLVTSNEYNTANQLVATRTYAIEQSEQSEQSNNRILSSTLICYNSLGQRNLTVSDMNLNGQIDWNDTDRIVSNDTRYVSLNGDWWRESSSWQTRQNGSPTLTRVGLTRTRLTGLASSRGGDIPVAAGVLTSETHSLDPLNNETVSCTTLDRATHTTTRTTETPASSLAAETVARCGLTASSRSATGVTTTYAYDALGRQISQTDGRGNTSHRVYDAQGRVAKTIDPLGNETTYAYDALGRQISVTDPLNHTVTTTYDAEGRVLAQRGATYPVDYTYDAYGNKVSMTTYRNESLADGDTTHWLYDEPSGCMTNKLYADGKGPSYDYTPDGKLARRVWARGIATDYTYDNAGQLVSTAYSDTTPTITMSYDRVGNLVNATTAGVVTNLYAYDLYGHCTNEWQNDFQLTRFYDPLGRATGYAINGTRQTTIAYDTYGRISAMTTATGGALCTGAAAARRSLECCVPPAQGGSGLPTASNGGEFTWTYLPGSDLKSSLSYPNGLTASWQYDANNQLLQVKNATATNIISQFDYTYDAAGRRVSIVKSGSAFGDLSGSVDAYTYNTRSELISARRTKNGQLIPGFSEDFAYDPIGNRTSSATYDEAGEAQVSTYVANALNQCVSRTTPGFAAVRGEADPDAAVTVNERPAYRLGAYFFGGDVFDNSASGGFARLETYAALAQADAGGNDADDLVSSVTGQVYVAQSPEVFAYDADGNQTRVTTRTGRWRVEYNGENRPILWTREGDGKTVAMSYDHMGRRRTKGGQRFFYDGYLQVANERTVSNELVRQSFVWDPTEPVATRPLAWFGSNAPPRLYTHDGNKNVSEVVAAASGTNAAVEVVAHYDYAAFGAVLAQKGDCAEANPWRFSSEYEDTDLGLDYYNYRHYEPVTGRWLNRDPIEESGGLLLYSMCNNSPLNLFDERGSSGSSWCECFGLCVTYNISQTWKMILAIDSAIATLDAAMETPFGPKAFNLGTEKVTSIGNKIFQLVKSSKSPIVKKMLKPLASWARTSGSMEWLPGLRSSSSLTRRIAKSLRTALRAARGLGTAALASVVLIEGKCASSCLYEDVQFEFKELLENHPEEFLFGTANE